ncbi:PhnD/SsuA/transferrin family substrate-binding protein [Thermus albus]|uniref:PhnD/SsuA/transferrin family substrate-binding protein n=1 Tax=Thermus albus TaxID=2908146 RepID=UPI001FAA74D1
MRPAWFGLVFLAGCHGLPDVALGPPYAPKIQEADVRVVVAGMLSPAEQEPYRVFLQGWGRALGLRVEVFGRRTYAEVLEVLRQGEAHLGFLCTLAAGLGVDKGFVEPILESDALFPYQSVVVVRKADPYVALQDLRGRPFAFTDPLSNTGHAWPRILASGLGEDFFSRAFFTYSHDRALVAVLQGLAEGAAVDRIRYETLGLRGLRVLASGPKDPAPPVVVPAGLPPEEKERWVASLLAYAGTEEGKSALRALGLRGFRKAEPDRYRAVYLRAKGVLP